METWKEFDHNEISHSAAHHLMAVDDLIRKFGYARVSDVARMLNITRGSVSISLQPLKKAGLILQDENRHIRLSPDGNHLVAAIKTKRVLMQKLFHQVLGVDAIQAEIDACKLEHLVSNTVAQKLITFLKFVESEEPAVIEFRKAMRSYAMTCDVNSAKCASCQVTGCMADAVSG